MIGRVGPAVPERPAMNGQRASVRQVNDDRMGPQADRQGLLRVLGRGGVPVPTVQAELPVAVGPDLLLPLDLKRPLRKRAQVPPLLGPELLDRQALLVVGPVKILFRLPQKLPVPALKAPNLRHRHEEVPPHVAHLVLDMPLLVARIRVAEAHREAVVAFEPQEQVVQADLVPDPPPHSAGVVEDDSPRHPADVTEDVPEPLADALGRLLLGRGLPVELEPPGDLLGPQPLSLKFLDLVNLVHSEHVSSL